jgi:hopanoid biosynthesis associated protein HpnK
MSALLIVNADDFGLEKEINSAIIEAHAKGIVTSASLLANGDAFEHAVELARKHSGLGIGAHLTLNRGPSLTGGPLLKEEVPSLAGRNGLFPKSPILFAARVALGAINLHEVEAELRAQLEKIRSAGIKITHIDSHQHIHLAPSVFEIVVRLAEAFRVNWVRLPIPPKSSPSRGPLAKRLKQTLLGKLALWNAGTVDSAVRWADYHVGIEHAGRLFEDELAGIIRALPDALVELSCHPGADNAKLSVNHPWNFRWQQEFSALCSPAVRAAVDEARVRLVNYHELADVKLAGR